MFKLGDIDLALDGLGHSILEVLNLELLVGVVTETVDLLNPLITNVLAAVVHVTLHCAERDRLIIIVSDNETVLLIDRALLDIALDTLESAGEENRVIMIRFEDCESEGVQNSANWEAWGLPGTSEIRPHPIKIALFDDTYLKPLHPVGDLANLEERGVDSWSGHCVDLLNGRVSLATLSVTGLGHNSFSRARHPTVHRRHALSMKSLNATAANKRTLRPVLKEDPGAVSALSVLGDDRATTCHVTVPVL